MQKKELFFSALLFFFLTSILLWQMLVKGMFLFPGDYLMAWFEPYKSENISDGTILIPHKPVNDDVFRHIFPFQTLAVSMIKQGELPLWNPYNGAGMPLLATLNSGLIDPTNVLYFFFPDEITWNITLFLQFLLIGFFTYLYTRSLSFHPLAAIFAAVAYMLSDFAIVRVSFAIYGFAMAALPLLLLIVEKYLTNPRTKLVFLVPVVFFILLTSTQPPITFYILLFTGLYFLARLITLKKTVKQKLLLMLVLAIFSFLGIALSAIQILPTVELLHYANLNRESSDYIDKFLVPVQHLISIGISNYFGNAATYNFWGQTDYVQTVAAIGLIPCFFAYLFIFFVKKTAYAVVKHIFTATIVITILMAVKSPISHFILTLPIPIISTDPPSRIFLLTTFAIAILAGGGVNYVINTKLTLLKKLLTALPFLLILTSIIGVTTYLHTTGFQCDTGFLKDCFTVAFRNTLLESGILSIGLAGFFLIPLFFKSIAGKMTAILLIVLVFGIGWYNAQKFFPFTTKAHFLPVSPFIHELQTQTQDGRVFGFGEATISTNLATFFRFYGPQYYHPLYIKRYGELTAYGNYGTLENTVLRSDAMIRNDLTLPSKDEKRRERLFNLLNVSYFIYPGTPPAAGEIIWQDNFRYITKNERALSRAFVVQDVLVKNNDDTILETLFSDTFDPKKTVLVEKNIPYHSTKEQLTSTIRIETLAENSVTINTTTSTDSLLVLLDNYYPGWNAYIDGNQTPVYRANYTFRTIVLPKGEHTVIFRYQPDSAKIGLMISVGSAILLSILFLWYSKNSRKHKHAHS
ncbi:MAG TPA: YfhO family protein [Patescibacteria group bacterium]|nr:YfhO family protein [Patescibacteria group bacterium]